MENGQVNHTAMMTINKAYWKKFFKSPNRSSHCGSAVMNLTCIHEDAGLIPDFLSGLGIPHCCELWCRSQTRLRSCVAVAVVSARSYSSDLTPSPGISICCRRGPQKKEKTDGSDVMNTDLHFSSPSQEEPSAPCFCAGGTGGVGGSGFFSLRMVPSVHFDQKCSTFSDL